METKLPKRVRVEKCHISFWWYNKMIGREFNVIEEMGDYWKVDVDKTIDSKGYAYILKSDCTPVFEEEEQKEVKPYEKQVGGTHYKGFAIQPAHFIHANGIGFLAGNVIKYVARYKSKNGVEDLKKAKHYIDLLIAEEYPEHPSTHE